MRYIPPIQLKKLLEQANALADTTGQLYPKALWRVTDVGLFISDGSLGFGGYAAYWADNPTIRVSGTEFTLKPPRWGPTSTFKLVTHMELEGTLSLQQPITELEAEVRKFCDCLAEQKIPRLLDSGMPELAADLEEASRLLQVLQIALVEKHQSHTHEQKKESH